ncbi:TetR/AcrR family transcriptional regulator [Microbacteriaceae bacterium K1510]|nr:TetR/AcrR family transcriptional regulator [Microbacteriaceae bacterium K1510]
MLKSRARRTAVKATKKTESPHRRRGRPKVMPDEMQRAHIVACAGRLLVEKGYGRTTTDDVAALCRISKQTLYRLFPNKAAVFAAVIDAHRQSVLALPGDYDALPLNVALENIFKIDISAQANQERIAVILAIMAEAPKFPELLRIVRRHGVDASQAELAAWLAGEQKRGRIAVDDVNSAASILMDMVFSRIFRPGLGLSMPTPQELQTHIRRCVSIFLNGVAPHGTRAPDRRES